MGSPTLTSTRLSRPRRKGLRIAAPSMRLKKEPQRLPKAIGTTGTGSVSRIFSTPPLKACRLPSRVMPPSGKMASISPSRSTCEAAAKARS